MDPILLRISVSINLWVYLFQAEYGAENYLNQTGEQENSENIEQGSAVSRPRIEQENSENIEQGSAVLRPTI